MDRDNIINNYSKKEFSDFLENDLDGKILELFNNEGIEILRNSKSREDKIKLILSSSKYKNELLKNINFLDVLLTSNINKFYNSLKNLDDDTYELILNRCIELSIDENVFARLFTFFSSDFKLKIIESKMLNLSIVINILNRTYDEKIVKKILDTYNIELTDEKVNVSGLFEKGKKSFLKNSINGNVELIEIHPSFITNDLAKRLWNEFDIFKLRKVVSDAAYVTSVDVLNKYIKEQEDNLIENAYSLDVNPRDVSNYIIDYHFEENYHNIILDMRELLQYYYDGNIVVDKNRIKLYEKIVNIDYLSLEEKQSLHEMMKQYNMMEMFYDDMRYARDIVSETIKEYSLSKESIKQFRDEELSKKYGVDVYKFDGQEFFGIVKTGRKITNKYPVGHSFSLIGTNGLAVFGNNTYGKAYIYDSDSLKKEQVVHVFPYDSYTRYKPFELVQEASMRVNTLMSPQKLTTHSDKYNEVLILEQGENETYMDEYIPRLVQLALYCVDEITEEDVLEAKENNVGIMLIDSSKYQEFGSDKNTINGFMQNEYNYFDGSFERDMYEGRRL